MGAAAFALLSVSPAGVSAEGGGSIALSASVCVTPEDAVTLYDCYTTDFVGEMTITSEDGTIYLTSADDTVHGGTSVWGEGNTLPYGRYFIDNSGLVIPDGYQLWSYSARFGDTGGSDRDDTDSASTTGTGRTAGFVGRVSGQDEGYAGETGAEVREAAERDS